MTCCRAAVPSILAAGARRLPRDGPESSYFFFPAAVPLNANYPRSTVEWARVFGQANARAFDRFGWAYYTAEFFDLFYPGYGDSWPSFRGAIGMTYEQAGHSAGGLEYRRRDGTLLTLADRVAHHFMSSLATVQAAAQNRGALLLDFWRFHEQAVWEGEHGPIREFLPPPGPDPAVADLVDLLMRQGMEVEVARRTFHVQRAVVRRQGVGTDVPGRHLHPRSAPATETPAQGVARAQRLGAGHLVLRHLRVVAAALVRTRLLHDRGAERSGARVPAAAVSRRAAASSPATARPCCMASLQQAGRLHEILCRLLEADLPVRIAREPFAYPNASFPRGSLIIPATTLSAAQVAQLDRIGQEQRTPIHPLKSYLTTDGIDLGSERVDALKLPVIAIMTGESFDANSVGAVRFHLEQRLHLQPTLLRANGLGYADLTRYNVLVFPSGGARVVTDNLALLQRSGSNAAAW
ncbi:MAG: hypothetical protein U1E76_23990 [Planctomycetota bacterium]